MNALETIVTKMAAELVKDDAQAERPVATTIEQRIAIGITQARAQEARQIAGQIVQKGLRQLPIMDEMYQYLWDRQAQLEDMAIKMVAVYPPDTQVEPVKMITLARA